MRKPIVVLASVAVLATAIGIAVTLVKTAPKARRKHPPKMAPVVHTQPLARTNAAVVLHQSGTVIPAEQVVLRARVSGEVVSMAPGFIEGGLLKKGEEMLEIDPTDYKLALAAAESKLATAEFNYKLELGRHDVARCEWEQLKDPAATEQEKELALRVPHLAASKAALQAAKAALAKAKLDLERTQIRAPFNAVVLERNVNIGSLATPTAPLARIAGTDRYWVRVSIAVDRLPWVAVPGATATVRSTSGAVRRGRVVRLLGDLESKGRMARLLVEVDDPLCLKPENKDQNRLLLGEYLQVDIQGRRLDGIYDIPRSALRENDQVWIARQGRLEVVRADVLWRGPQRIFVHAPLRKEGDDERQLVVSDLATPIPGMELTPVGGKGGPRAGKSNGGKHDR